MEHSAPVLLAGHPYIRSSYAGVPHQSSRYPQAAVLRQQATCTRGRGSYQTRAGGMVLFFCSRTTGRSAMVPQKCRAGVQDGLWGRAQRCWYGKPGASTLLSGCQVLEGDGKVTNRDCCVVGVALTIEGIRVWDAKAAATVEIDTRNVPAYFWIEQQITRQIV